MEIAVLFLFGVAVLAAPVSRWLGTGASYVLSLAPLGVFCLLAWHIGSVSDGAVLTSRWEWIPSLGISFSFLLDGLSLSFALLISGIGTLIVLYSGAYMAGHRSEGRFYSVLFLFMASMLGVVLADNLITLFLFWELTSVTSYLLIGFESQHERNRYAALQALLVTGVGGLALLAGLLLMGHIAGTYEFSELLRQGDSIRGSAVYGAVLVLVLAGAFTKSAQFPFHFWLPNAMAAPTPVSAFLHSSTMVKAGVYLLARMSPVLGGTDAWWYALVLGGTATALVGAYLALRQTVLKSLLAYTTVSALGMLTASIGIGTPEAATAMVTFLFVHAFYKAALFMTAGALDHETGEKDVERLGGLARAMPLTALGGMLGALSMAGLPPLLGFVGKETLYGAAVHGAAGHGDNVRTAWLLGAALVAANAVNVWTAALTGIKPFFGSLVPTPRTAHEGRAGLWTGPLVLGIFALGLGFVPQLLGGSLVQTGAESIQNAPVPVKLVHWHGFTAALWMSLVTLAAGAALYVVRKPLRNALQRLKPLDALGPEAWYDRTVNAMLAFAGWQTRIIQNGYLRNYLLVTLGFIVLFPGSVLLLRVGISWPGRLTPPQVYELLVGGLMIVGAVCAVRARSRLAAVASLGVVGYCVALVFVLFGAPDLAMTQFVVETLTVIIFVLVLYYLPPFVTYSNSATRIRDLFISIVAGLFMTSLVIAAFQTSYAHPISDYYAANSYVSAHGRNIVNVILVDFRALDTLGELTVLAVAAVGAYAMLHLRASRGRSDS
jgi:multicomponent Na+:H+ antiporter subunit A